MSSSLKLDLPLLDFEKPLGPLYQKLAKLIEQNKDKTEDKKILSLTQEIQGTTQKLYKNLTHWQLTQLARHPSRPYALDYFDRLFIDFTELHGDRNFRDDPSTVCGFAKFNDISVVVIGQQKGRSTEENVKRNFGMPQPEGYRKALRFFELAEKFNKPVITFIDTPGAYPGLASEERSQGEAIARNLRVMAGLKVPIISIVIGEGGSGGALGIGVANHVMMMEYSVYSVISPESCASILWRSADEKEKAASALKNDAKTALKYGIIDEIIPEPLGGAHRDYNGASSLIQQKIAKILPELMKKKPDTLSTERIEKFSKMGVTTELSF